VPEPSEGAKAVLNNVIQQEVGTLVGGERARSLLATVKEELSRLVTDTRKPRANGPLDAAMKLNEALTNERLDVETRLRELDQSLDALAKLRSDLKRIADPADIAKMKRELTEATEQLKAADTAAQSLQRHEADERQSFELAKAQQEKLEALRSRAASIDGNRSRLKDLATLLAPLDEEEAQAARLLNEALTRKSELDAQAEKLATRERQLQRLAAAVQKATFRETIATRLAALQIFETKRSTNDAALKASTVDDAAIKSLESIEREAATITARIEAGAARITVERKPGTSVTVNGSVLAENFARAVTEPLTIQVGDDVAITVSPPPSSIAAAEAEQRMVRDKLKSLLARHGTANADDLRRMRQDRVALEEISRDLRAERSALGLREGSPLAEIQALSAEIGQIDAETRRVLSETGTGTLPSVDEMETWKQAHEEHRSTIREARAQCEGMITGQNTILSRVAAQRGALSGEMKAIDSQLRTDLASLPDDRREIVLGDCARDLESKASDHRAKAALLAEKRATAPEPGEADRLRGRVQRFTAAIQNSNDAVDKLKQEIARLEGQIQTAGGDGLGERVANLKTQQEMALAELERQQERVAVLALLRDKVEQSYAKRREQLNAPLRRHLKPFLNDVFPQAEIDLGENFAVEGLKRSGPASELFGRLSHGTQEQIAVLIRLAMGAMVCERGEDVPIILDDALVYSDDDRIEQMFDAINRAGRNQQVIVFTCRARLFSSLGGRQIHIA
jgi:DNA repair exonuclease SbcCD ATPase subunit